MSQRIEIDTDRKNAPKVLERLKYLFHWGEKVILLSRQKEKSDLLSVIESSNVIVRSYSTAKEILNNTPRGQSNTIFLIENTTETDFSGFINNAMNPTNSVILLNVKDNTEKELKLRKVLKINIEEDCNDAQGTIKKLIDMFYGIESQFSLNGLSIKIEDKE